MYYCAKFGHYASSGMGTSHAPWALGHGEPHKTFPYVGHLQQFGCSMITVWVYIWAFLGYLHKIGLLGTCP